MNLVQVERFRPGRRDWIQAAAVAAVMFALYAVTAPRSVSLEDDGLFILSSYFLGIEHPPGYPLFTLIGHLFTMLPFGPVAYRVHLASALFGALTCAFAWLCARSLIREPLVAYLSAFALGISPVFWSQSIIAEVYTLNTFFFLVLVFLGLQICPPGMGAARPVEERRAGLLALMAFVFGLSLSNHWPLMLLTAPGFVVLLWPVREQVLNRFGLLSWLVILGLLPYAWLILRSWSPLPISFYGPLETLSEIWYFVSRAGYAGIDHPISSNWLDRIKFFEYFGGQLLVQFAILGTAIAAVGFTVQWRILGHRIAAFLTATFLGPSALLLLLLGFDYSSITAHVFHVYPLPAYAVAALWMALGFIWLMNRWFTTRAKAALAAAGTLGLIFAIGARTNIADDHDWGARYAKTILKTLPANAVVFVQGEADMGTMAYFQMIENMRPDITLYQAKGLVLGNRLFHPLRSNFEMQKRAVREMIEKETNPIAFTLDVYTGYARKERWLYSIVDKSSTDPSNVKVDIPEEAVRFFDQSVERAHDKNAWIAFLQSELRRRYAEDVARSLPRNRAPDESVRKEVEALSNDFAGALGLATGLMENPAGYSSGAIVALLQRAVQLMPRDVDKRNLARFFHLRGALRATMQDKAGAIADFETAISVWPTPSNTAFEPLEELYRTGGNLKAADAVQTRLKSLKARPY